MAQPGDLQLDRLPAWRDRAHWTASLDPERLVLSRKLHNHRVGQNLAQRDDATFAISALVLPDGYTVAGGQRFPTSTPPLLISFVHRGEDSEVARMRSQDPIRHLAAS